MTERDANDPAGVTAGPQASPPPPAVQPAPQAYAPPPAAAPVARPKEKVVAGILGILLGTYGAHKFYLGYTVEAVTMLVVSLVAVAAGGVLSVVGVGVCLFPIASAMGLIGMVEGIVYLTRTDQEFYYTYVLNKKAWF